MKKKAAFFDICHTLVQITTVSNFTKHFLLSPLRNKKFKISKWIYHISYKILRKLGIVSESAYREHFVRLFTGYSELDLEPLAQEYANHLQRFLKPEIFDKFNELKRAGYKMYLVTAGFDATLKPFAKTLGATLVATELEKNEQGIYTGKIAGIDCIGQGKVQKIKSRVLDSDVDWNASFAFGNDAPDIPMLSLVGNSCVVDPDFVLEKHAHDYGWRIIKTTIPTKATFVTFADLGKKRNLKTDAIAPTVRYFAEKGKLDTVICRMGNFSASGVKEYSAVPWILHAMTSGLGRMIPNFPARRCEENVFDFFASHNISKKGIVFFHPVCFPKTINKARAAGSVCVGITTIADQNYVRALHAAEVSKWKGKLTDTTFDRDFSHDMDYLITYSPSARDSYVQKGYKPENIFIASPDVDANRFVPSNSSDHKTFTVLFPASNTGVLKGLQYLLDAWREVAIPNKKLIIMGKRSHWPQKMEEHYSKIIDTDLTIMEIGLVKNPVPIIQSSHVVVLPSFTEGFSRSVAEAMACGVPVITTDRATDTKNFFVSGEHGFIVPLADSKSIAEKIMFLHDHEDKRKIMGERARQAVLIKKPFCEQVFEIMNIVCAKEK